MRSLHKDVALIESERALYGLNDDGDATDDLEILFRTMANDVFSAINEQGNI
jgi:hypothetical protein